MAALAGVGKSLQKMHEVAMSSVPKTLTSGRLRTLFHLLFTQSVDPDLSVEGGWGRNLVDKAFRVLFVGVEHGLFVR